MKITISFSAAKYQRLAKVHGLTAAKLIESRVSETSDSVEQISEIDWKGKPLRVVWALREASDSLGHACALPWEKKDEADHVEIGLATYHGSDVVECAQSNSALQIV